jgi:hypothetical protein
MASRKLQIAICHLEFDTMPNQALPIDPHNMAKAYDPKTFELPIYEWWESSGYFKPELAKPDAEPFVISIPPPNVTG